LLSRRLKPTTAWWFFLIFVTVTKIISTSIVCCDTDGPPTLWNLCNAVCPIFLYVNLYLLTL
jgi:hypothetical protein